MQRAGASAKPVTRGDEPSSAGQGVGPVIEAPTGAGVGTGRPPAPGSGRPPSDDGSAFGPWRREPSPRPRNRRGGSFDCGGERFGTGCARPIAFAVVALLVQKFGGTSVADPERIRAVADHVARTVRRGNQVVVVISAMGKETDELLRLAREVSNTRPGREMDMLVTAGERKATALLCMAIADLGVEAESFTGSQAGFLTDSTHMNAKITEVRPDRIREALDAGRVPVVGGAQGVSPERNVTFLGRGGSDTTAVAIAHALGAQSCELYTDVSGVFTSDPRVVTDARRMDRISFDELLEMTANGCPKPAM